jgi:threonine dehydratase
LTCRFLDDAVGARLFFKCEPFQRIGAFKFRGACNAVLALPEERARRGVVTHSSGNHGQALALAAKLRGIPATVVMPASSAKVKIAAVEGQGARIVLCENGNPAREAATKAVIDATGAALVHPYDDRDVIAGQGTAALELVAEVPSLDTLITPVGGGGLLSGTALVARHANVAAFGAEPEIADDARRSLEAGRIVAIPPTATVADGLRTTAIGPLTFGVLQASLAASGGAILVASESEILAAMRLVWERMKVVIEPSAAVPVAVLLRHRSVFAGRTIGVVLSGGNVDLAPFLA